MKPATEKLIRFVRYSLAEYFFQIYGLVLLFSLFLIWSYSGSILIVCVVGVGSFILAWKLYDLIHGDEKKK